MFSHLVRVMKFLMLLKDAHVSGNDVVARICSIITALDDTD
jgi:hypothetical protein